MKYFLTFDVGTTSVKTCIFDEKLVMRGYSSEEYELITPAAGIVEEHPEVYWQAVKSGLIAACENASVMSNDISAISITTQGETLIPVDENGNSLTNAIVWEDDRAEKQASDILHQYDSQEFYRHTGISTLNGFVPIAKLCWIRENEPEIFRDTYKFLLLEDYLIYRFTGRFVTEKSLLSTTGWFDIVSDSYWKGIMDTAEIPEDKLPDALECGTVVGKVLPEVQKELGLSDHVNVITSAMDQVTAAIGASNIRPGIVTETTGTAMCIAATVATPDFENTLRVNLYRHYQRGKYLILPVCMTAGIVLKWFKDEFCKSEIEEAAEKGCSAYDIISLQVGTVPPLADGLTMVPYFTGTQQPENDPAARGVFYGVGLNTGRKQFQRAIFEAVAYMLRENIELIEKVENISVAEIRSLGGGARSHIWRQIKADVTQCRILSMKIEECSSLGAAMLAAVASGCYPNLDMLARVNKIKEGINPNPELKNVYNRGFRRFQMLYHLTKEMKKL